MLFRSFKQGNQLSTSSQKFRVFLGLGITVNAADQNNGVYVEYDIDTDANYWITTCANGGTRTRTSSTFALPSNAYSDFFSFRIIVLADRSHAYFYGRKNGGAWTLLNDMTTNIPANNTGGQVFPIRGIVKSVGTTACTIQIDAYDFYCILTNER